MQHGLLIQNPHGRPALRSRQARYFWLAWRGTLWDASIRRSPHVSGGKARTEVAERTRHREIRVRLDCTVDAASRLGWDV